MEHQLTKIKAQLELPLPGRKAQFEMTNISRTLDYTVPDDARHAGVMLLLFPVDNQLNVTFIQRASSNPNDPHSGQISFPGGKFEQDDSSLLACALRETEEEIGIPRHQIQVLGALTQLYVPVSNFDVHPFVGFLAQPPIFKKQETEVKSIIHVPVTHFFQENIKGYTDITVKNFTMQNVPYFELLEHRLWGATSMITNEFLHIWNNIK